MHYIFYIFRSHAKATYCPLPNHRLQNTNQRQKRSEPRSKHRGKEDYNYSLKINTTASSICRQISFPGKKKLSRMSVPEWIQNFTSGLCTKQYGSSLSTLIDESNRVGWVSWAEAASGRMHAGIHWSLKEQRSMFRFGPFLVSLGVAFFELTWTWKGWWMLILIFSRPKGKGREGPRTSCCWLPFFFLLSQRRRRPFL